MDDASPPSLYRYGEIVLVADLLDPNGLNPKDRPCVVVTDPKSPLPDRRQIIVAISTVVPEPLPPGYVLLPWYRPHHPVTGLNKRAAAICPWLEEVGEDRILRKLGVVPDAHLLRIAAELLRRP
jgi:mRNA-degrading endonuclease toxin of MazEF toxin-antitoxin module